LAHPAFELQFNGLINLGAGVAYKAESQNLHMLHKNLRTSFLKDLTPQDQQPLRPHITIMNKSTSEHSRALLALLSKGFDPFIAKAIGLYVWVYMGGPWQHKLFRSFININ
jgi:2'-5' RNA ligase